MNKLQLDPDHSEIIQLGLFMGCQDFLHIGLWGFMGNLVVMTPNKLRSILVWAGGRPSRCKSRGATWCCSSAVTSLLPHAMVQEANKGTWLNNSDHPHTIDWGTLRVDFDSL